jgi:hypothetical protein
MHPVAYLELGLPEEFPIWFGDQQTSDLQDFLPGAYHHQVRQPLGFRFLFRTQMHFRHGASR